MAFRFRKSIGLGKGARINLSKRGVGVSVGTRGARVSVGKRGVRGSVGIPGTGLSYETNLSGKRARATGRSMQRPSKDDEARGTVAGNTVVVALIGGLLLGVFVNWVVGILFFGLVLIFTLRSTVRQADDESAGQLPRKEPENSTHIESMEEQGVHIDQNGARQLERDGDVSKAIEVYESVITAGFDGNMPFDRLAIIYRKQRRYDDEVRVLEQAVKTFVPIAKRGRSDGGKKLAAFMERLEKARLLQVGDRE